ncbi:MAG: DUF86 domain-containing protein [candidate division NC10 bacterium]|nr:DUF86 domain-containing protein [candidate division NC10 bacterium]MDE2321965.1 DUF86 domain-containing protein [candidate division NC10 bacterium]
MSYDEFASDFRNLDSALHRLQAAIQALVDLGSYVIASLGLRTPSSSAEAIDILVENGLLPIDHRDRFVSMIQFRNRIVHFDNDIDLKILHHILLEELVDIRELYHAFIRFIEEHPDEYRTTSVAAR